MIGYVTIGALDSDASGKFYDALFVPSGGERKFADGGWIGYGKQGGGKTFMDCYSAVCPPQNGETRRCRQWHHDRLTPPPRRMR